MGKDRLVIGSFRLTVVSGPDEGTVYESSGDAAVVGTHDSADLVLTDRRVSRFHCEFVVDAQGVEMRDLDSRNGTRIENAWISSARLRGPTILTIGETKLRFEERVDSIEIALAPGEVFGKMVGASERARSMFALLQRAASARVNLLFEGEGGVGKSVAADSVHAQGERADGPFGVVDCSAPDRIVRNELLGHDDDISAFEMCDGGTLVLDDIGALSLDTQMDLLRVLEAGAVARGGHTFKFDTRVISTTRRNLRRDINAGTFRARLFAEIGALRVQFPPLREYLRDLPVLVAHFLTELDALGTPAARDLMDGAAIEALRTYRWPGNVGELRRHVERCVMLNRAIEPSGDASDDDDAVPVVDTSVELKPAREAWIRYFERAYMKDMLARTAGNVSAAARKAGIDRVHFYRLLKRAGLK